jgi:putative ABC transport system permease protein
VLLIGFDPKTDFSVVSWMAEAAKGQFTDNDIIVGREIPTLKGRELSFYGELFRVKGVLAPTGMNYLDNSAFITLDAAYDMADKSGKQAMTEVNVTREMISTVLVKAADGYSPNRVATKIEYAIDGVKAIPSNEVVTTVKESLSKLFAFLFAIGGVVWIMALLLIAVVFSMIVNERQREIGLLRAMGAKKGFMFRLIMVEAGMLTTLGGVIGVTLGGVGVMSFKNLITTKLNIPYLWPPTEFIALLLFGCIAISLVTGILAALYPAFLSSRMEPYNAIRKGE